VGRRARLPLSIGRELAPDRASLADSR
jgi:hypothetical protein